MMFKSTMFVKAMTVLLTAAMLASCATILGQSSPESLNVRSAPDQAAVTISDESGMKIYEGKTPTILTLEKKRGFFSGKKYTVNISKPGFHDYIATIDTRLNGWYLGGNIILGGLIGWLIVDPATGAMWTLDRNEVNATLQAVSGAGLLRPDTTGIVLLQDVPESLRSKMAKVSPK